MSVGGTLRELLAPLFEDPELCGFCHGAKIERYGLCGDCASRINSAHSARELETPYGILAADGFGVYNQFMRTWYGRYKFHGETVLEEGLAEYLSERLEESGLYFDWITYVPMSRKKECLRGYNPVLRIARECAGNFDVPLVHLLEKRSTAEQNKLSRVERATNVKGAFSLIASGDEGFKTEHSGVFRRKRTELGGQGLLLDDLLTSGNTMAEAGGALLAAGFSIRCAVLATAAAPKE